LILALFVLAAGKPSVVKATITGSIVGNSLLGLGLAIVVGSWGGERQTFQPERAGLLGTLLIISVIALLVPALFDFTERNLQVTSVGAPDERLSLGVAVVLILAYGANLVYTLVTHRDIFGVEEETGEPGVTCWPLWRALAVLVAATAAVAFEAELVAHALEATAEALSLTPFFLGVIVLPEAGIRDCHPKRSHNLPFDNCSAHPMSTTRAGAPSSPARRSGRQMSS
jgi:Ca2+:H+ antiporter